MIAGTRLRGGNASSARGAASMITEAVSTARAPGCTGTLVVRMDSAFYGSPAVAAPAGPERVSPSRCAPTPRSAPRSPPSARMPGRRSAIPAPSGMTSWAAGSPTPRSRRCEYTAFASRGQAITARLIVRRVKDLNRNAAPGQGELFTAWRYHAVFTDSPFVMLQAEEQHRGHAQAEQVFADWTDGPLAHLPSGSFPANAAWLALAAISCNLLRAAGTLASLAYAKARGATLRRDLIDVAARTARHGRGHLTLHLPEGWHREHEWMNLLETACGHPPQRPDQPRPGHRPPRPLAPADRHHTTPATNPRTSRRTVSGRKTTPPPAPETNGQKPITQIHAVDQGFVPT